MCVSLFDMSLSLSLFLNFQHHILSHNRERDVVWLLLLVLLLHPKKREKKKKKRERGETIVSREEERVVCSAREYTQTPQKPSSLMVMMRDVRMRDTQQKKEKVSLSLSQSAPKPKHSSKNPKF